jgi:hypothetical protein
MEAKTILTLYRHEDLMIIAEVQPGEKFFIPFNVLVYEGSLENFLKENPKYDRPNLFIYN